MSTGKKTMNRKLISLCVFSVLIALGVAVRLGFQHIPNFAPVAALALFSGYYFRNTLLAASVPLLVMGISDRWIDAGGYDWRLQFTVYGLLAMPVAFASPLRRWLTTRPNASTQDSPILRRTSQCVLTVGGFSIGSSLLFFFGTNIAVWLSWYPQTLAGLAQCFLAALPFFRYTLAGDAVFTIVLFGTSALVTLWHHARQTQRRWITSS